MFPQYCQIVTDKYIIFDRKKTNAIIKSHLKTLGKESEYFSTPERKLMDSKSLCKSF
jgi:hypothetical protein